MVDGKFTGKFGFLLEGIKNLTNETPNKNLIAQWKSFYLQRWTITIMILVSIRDYQGFQISLLLPISILFQAILIRSKPFDDRIDNMMALFNELSTSIYLYQALLLTDSAVDPPLRPQLGNQLGIFVIAVVSINLIRAAFKIFRGLKRFYLRKRRS